MKISKLKKFDAAEHLQTPEARAEYLSMIIADGDPNEVRDAINVAARAEGMSKGSGLGTSFDTDDSSPSDHRS